jgi:hypothetical protein
MKNQPHEQSLGRIDEILDDSPVWAEPPGAIEPAVLAAITGSERVDVVRRAPSTGRKWWGYAAAALVAAVAAFIVFFPLGDDDSAPTAVIALSGAGVEGEAAVGAADAGWWIHMNVTGLNPAPEGSFYEGWVSDGHDMISVGTFHMRDGTYVTLWSGVPLRDYPELLVTLQEVGGGPEPSSEIVVSGRLES